MTLAESWIGKALIVVFLMCLANASPTLNQFVDSLLGSTPWPLVTTPGSWARRAIVISGCGGSGTATITITLPTGCTYPHSAFGAVCSATGPRDP